MIWLWSIAALTILVAWYTSPIGREWLKKQPWTQWYYCSPFAERVEIILFNKSDTVLYARFKLFLAAAWQLVLQVGAIDPTPFLVLIPQEYHTIVLAAPSIIMAIDGIIGEIQRRWTTLPLKVVEVPDASPVPPEVRAAVQEVKEKKAEAVAIVREAEREGRV